MNLQLIVNIVDYREGVIIAITESWLEDEDLDETVDTDGFFMVRSDSKMLAKEWGGGVAAYSNEKWCKQVTVKQTFCDDYLQY